MLRQFLVGATVSACTIVIHAMIMTTVVRVAHEVRAQAIGWAWLKLAAIMITTASVLMVAHVCEVIVWAISYDIVNAVPEGTAHMYFAFVNYTTLGYGDITPVPRWQLLGPMTAMNGILLFGWSTAVIFEVLRKAMLLMEPATAQT